MKMKITDKPTETVKGTREPVNNNLSTGLSFSYDFTSDGYYKFLTIAYIIQTIIDKYLNITVKNERSYEYNYDFNKYKQIVIEGDIIFYYNKQLFIYKISTDGFKNKILSNGSTHLFVKIIKDEIKNNNPLRNKHLYIYDTSDCLAGTIKKRPTVNFSDVILDDTLKSDIYDNTIFHLEKMVENNGIILFGKPGVGKSLVCSAIINEAINKGFSTCYLCSKVNFESLSELIREFLTPCILIYEDIDSLGQDRKETINTELSSFLQFINGLTEGNDRIVFIATTNYLEHLDDAIKNRPMRFNRKFEFKYPNNDQINKLITLYFDKKTSDKYSTTCYNKNFTGAHIKEIKRTATILSVKDNTDIDSVFEKSVKLVYDNFSITLRNKPGF